MNLELSQILTIVLSIVFANIAVILPMFFWLRSEANADRREMAQMMKNLGDRVDKDIKNLGDKVDKDIKNLGDKVDKDLKGYGDKIDSEIRVSTQRTDKLYGMFLDLLKQDHKFKTNS